MLFKVIKFTETLNLLSGKDLFKKQILNNLWFKMGRMKFKGNISKLLFSLMIWNIEGLNLTYFCQNSNYP